MLSYSEFHIHTKIQRKESFLRLINKCYKSKCCILLSNKQSCIMHDHCFFVLISPSSVGTALIRGWRLFDISFPNLFAITVRHMETGPYLINCKQVDIHS